MKPSNYNSDDIMVPRAERDELVGLVERAERVGRVLEETRLKLAEVQADVRRFSVQAVNAWTALDRRRFLIKTPRWPCAECEHGETTCLIDPNTHGPCDDYLAADTIGATGQEYKEMQARAEAAEAERDNLRALVAEMEGARGEKTDLTLSSLDDYATALEKMRDAFECNIGLLPWIQVNAGRCGAASAPLACIDCGDPLDRLWCHTCGHGVFIACPECGKQAATKHQRGLYFCAWCHREFSAYLPDVSLAVVTTVDCTAPMEDCNDCVHKPTCVVYKHGPLPEYCNGYVPPATGTPIPGTPPKADTCDCDQQCHATCTGDVEHRYCENCYQSMTAETFEMGMLHVVTERVPSIGDIYEHPSEGATGLTPEESKSPIEYATRMQSRAETAERDKKKIQTELDAVVWRAKRTARKLDSALAGGENGRVWHGKLPSREYRLQVVWDWPTLDYDHAHRVHDNHAAAAAHATELIEAGMQDVRIQHQQSYVIDLEIDTAAGLHDDDVISHNDPLNPAYIIVDRCFESAEVAMKPFCVSQCSSANSYEYGTCPQVYGPQPKADTAQFAPTPQGEAITVKNTCGPAIPAHKIEVTCIVCGERVRVAVSPDEPIYVMRNRALEQSGNTGRHPDHWEVRDFAGARLDHRMVVGPDGCGLAEGSIVYVSLLMGGIGADGATERQECRCHTEMDGHTPVVIPRENCPTAWELLNRAAKRLPKVEDADLRRLLTDVINATRNAVELAPEGGLLTEATDKYILGRKSQFLPTDKYLQECAERLHDKVCFLKTCDWHTSTWDEPKYERKRYLAYAFRVLMLGIDIDDACRVLHIWREEI